MLKFLILMCIYGIFATVTVLRGCIFRMYQKSGILNSSNTSVVFFSRFQKSSSVWVMFLILLPP